MQNVKEPYGSTFQEFDPEGGVEYKEKKAVKYGSYK
jgi:hypothetical protein